MKMLNRPRREASDDPPSAVAGRLYSVLGAGTAQQVMLSRQVRGGANGPAAKRPTQV
jgi:hypothetical protein